MRNTVNPRAISGQATSVDLIPASGSTPVDLKVELLRQVIVDMGVTFDVIEATTQKDRSYAHAMLKGEKPFQWTFFRTLPEDVQAEYHSRCAESYGRIVVDPAYGDDAVRDLVRGLFGVLALQLPLRAERMAKADLSSARPRKVSTQ